MEEKALERLFTRLLATKAAPQPSGTDEIEGIVRKLLSEERKSIPPEELVSTLKGRYASLLQTHGFEPGQIVRWKPGLSNKRRPRPSEPAIVTRVLAEPLVDSEQSAGSNYFREPLDIVLGIIVEDDFVEYYFDSRRFEPFV